MRSKRRLTNHLGEKGRLKMRSIKEIINLHVKRIVSGYSAHYVRISTLMAELALKRAEGDYLKWLKRMKTFRLLVLDDLGLMALTVEQTQELLEVIEARNSNGSIIITSQLPIKEWYAYFKNPTLADAITDRLIHNAYKINLKGESMRKIKNSITLSDF